MQDIFADFKDVYLRNVSLDNAKKFICGNPTNI